VSEVRFPVNLLTIKLLHLTSFIVKSSVQILGRGIKTRQSGGIFANYFPSARVLQRRIKRRFLLHQFDSFVGNAVYILAVWRNDENAHYWNWPKYFCPCSRARVCLLYVPAFIASEARIFASTVLFILSRMSRAGGAIPAASLVPGG